MPKNLVICCDGTANEATGESTNVLRLYRSLQRDAQQLCYYDGGVGTLADPRAITKARKLVLRYLDLGIALGIRENFCEAYAFLVRHYEPGDQVYLFGFSRGAYTARAVAGAIKMLGLLRPELEGQVPYVWSIYAGEGISASTKRRFGRGARFRKCFARGEDVRVHFVGAFDTVSSFGWIWDWRSLPYTANNDKIDHVRHAIAIDERRSCYGANLFFPATPPERASCKQVWFAGVHCDVGGGYPEAQSALSKHALRWMLAEAEGLGLRTDPAERDRMIMRPDTPGAAPSATGMLHDSMIPAWRVVECFPRRSWHNGKQRVAWQMPNFFRRRQWEALADPPRVHQSVVDRNQAIPSYRPAILSAPNLMIEP